MRRFTVFAFNQRSYPKLFPTAPNIVNNAIDNALSNLASHLLAQFQRRLPHDWERRYALRPVLLETFCETSRFLGTCYQSANWLCVGQTQGRGKLDVHRQSALPVKSVRLKPLQKNWRTILCR